MFDFSGGLARFGSRDGVFRGHIAVTTGQHGAVLIPFQSEARNASDIYAGNRAFG